MQTRCLAIEDDHPHSSSSQFCSIQADSPAQEVIFVCVLVKQLDLQVLPGELVHQRLGNTSVMLGTMFNV